MGKIVCFDRQRGRGQMGAKSPLLWDEGQVERLLAGSPVVNMVRDRLKVLLFITYTTSIMISMMIVIMTLKLHCVLAALRSTWFMTGSRYCCSASILQPS